MISKFYTLKGRRRKTSNVKTCKKKVWKKVKKKLRSMPASPKEQKRKEIKKIQIKFYISVDIRAI